MLNPSLFVTASTPKPCENVTILLRIKLHWTSEFDGPKGKLESSHRDEVVRKERNRVVSLEHVRFCELGGPKEAREQPQGRARDEGEEQVRRQPLPDEDSESKISVENHLRYKFDQ